MTLEMKDGITLTVGIATVGKRRITVFKTRDVDFLADSVLYEIFLAVGGDVIAYSPSGDEYKIKAFSSVLD